MKLPAGLYTRAAPLISLVFPHQEFLDVCFVSASHRQAGKNVVKILPVVGCGDSGSRNSLFFMCMRACENNHNECYCEWCHREKRVGWKLKCKKSSLDTFMINVWQIMAFSDWRMISCKRLLIYLEISHSGKFVIKLTVGWEEKERKECSLNLCSCLSIRHRWFQLRFVAMWNLWKFNTHKFHRE